MTFAVLAIILAGSICYWAMPSRMAVFEKGQAAGRKEAEKALKERAEEEHQKWATGVLSEGFEAGVLYAETGKLPSAKGLGRAVGRRLGGGR